MSILIDKPAVAGVAKKGMRWRPLTPIAYRAWTGDRRLRHASLKGMRDDADCRHAPGEPDGSRRRARRGGLVPRATIPPKMESARKGNGVLSCPPIPHCHPVLPH